MGTMKVPTSGGVAGATIWRLTAPAGRIGATTFPSGASSIALAGNNGWFSGESSLGNIPFPPVEFD
jgi:hypothetical protein